MFSLLLCSSLVSAASEGGGLFVGLGGNEIVIPAATLTFGAGGLEPLALFSYKKGRLVFSKKRREERLQNRNMSKISMRDKVDGE